MKKLTEYEGELLSKLSGNKGICPLRKALIKSRLEFPSFVDKNLELAYNGLMQKAETKIELLCSLVGEVKVNDDPISMPL